MNPKVYVVYVTLNYSGKETPEIFEAYEDRNEAFKSLDRWMKRFGEHLTDSGIFIGTVVKASMKEVKLCPKKSESQAETN